MQLNKSRERKTRFTFTYTLIYTLNSFILIIFFKIKKKIVFFSSLFLSCAMQDDRLIAECRVRYLSFLGIGKNVKNCAFIMHTAQDKFICHVFLCEPSSGALCKTIEAACKVNDAISNRRFRR